MQTDSEVANVMNVILMRAENVSFPQGETESALIEGQRQCQWMQAEWQHGCAEHERLKSEVEEITKEEGCLNERRTKVQTQWTELLELLDQLKLEDQPLVEELKAQNENEPGSYRTEWHLLSKCMGIHMRHNKEKQELLGVFLKEAAYGGVIHITTEGRNPGIVARHLWECTS